MHVSLNSSGRKINGAVLASAQEMLPVMEKYDIERSVLMSSGEKDCLMDNNELKEICRRYPDKFSYMVTFDLEQQDGLEERVAAEKEAGAAGIGEFTSNYAFDDPKVWNLLGILERHRLPLLFHMTPQLGNYYGVYDEGGLPRLERALEAFPAAVIIAHSQPFWYEMTRHEAYSPEERNSYPSGKIDQEGRVQELLRRYPNLYCDLSANSAGTAIMRDPEYGQKFLDEFQDRLLYGTDLYNTDQVFGLGAYLDDLERTQKLSVYVYEKIIRRNAEKVLGL